MWSLVLSDQQITIQVLADMLSIEKPSVDTISNENLGPKKLCAKIIPNLLSLDQKLRKNECCIDWKNSTQTPNFLGRNITGEESWFYEHHLELKPQNME